MKHNEDIILSHLVGMDQRARDYIFKKHLADQIIMKKAYTSQKKLELVTN
jgi:hypothetical protein